MGVFKELQGLGVGCPLSLRQVEELMAERGVDISYEWIRVHRSGASRWARHLDEVYVRINGRFRYFWPAFDHEGDVLDFMMSEKRDKAAALRLLRRLLKRKLTPLKS